MTAQQKGIRIIATVTAIRPEDIPQKAYDQSCAALSGCIRRAMADPERRKAFEKWKSEKGKTNRIAKEVEA